VEIGAFRTLPAGTTNRDFESDQPIPMEKIQDFGLHMKHYYSLPIEFFKSSLDAKLLMQLWSKYWIDTISQSPLLVNREFTSQMVADCVAKLQSIGGASAGIHPSAPMWSASDQKGKTREQAITKVAMDAGKIGTEQIQGITSELIKRAVFLGKCGCQPSGDAPQPMDLA